MTAKVSQPMPEGVDRSNRPKPPAAPPRIRSKDRTKASILVSPEHPNYEILIRYTAEGMRMRLDEGEFSVSGFEMQGNNLKIWLEEI